VQRRRLAILAFLASAGPRGVPRERLLAVFSPERDQASARHALEQALYALRKGLGVGVVEGVDPVCVGEALSYDVREFEAAMGCGDMATAVTRYGGPFLDGLHLSDSPNFEQWAETERSRLATAFRRALTAEAERQERDGNWHEAAGLWRRLTAEDPLAADGARGQVRCLVAAGEHRQAGEIVEGWEQLARLELETEPDPSVRLALDTPAMPPVSGQLESSHRLEAPHAGARPQTVPAGPPDLRRTRRRYLVAALLTAAAVLLVLVVRPRAVRPMEPGTETVRGDLLLLPFTVSDDAPDLQALGRTLPELIAAQVIGPDESIVPVNASRREAGEAGRLTAERLASLERRFGASRALVGQIAGTAGSVAVTASMVASNGQRSYTATTLGSTDSIAALIARTATALLRESTRGRLTAAGPVALPVLQAYAWGRNAFGRERYHQATAHLRRALALDSTFAPAALLLHSSSAKTDGIDVDRADRLAWLARERLTPADRDFLLARLGPDYPRLSARRPTLERIRHFAGSHLYHADGWLELGTLLFNIGYPLGEPDPWGEALSALEWSLSLDSMAAAPARAYLIEMAAITADTALLDRILAAGSVRGTEASERVFRQWLRAFTARDTAALATIRPRLASLDTLRLLDVRATGLRAGFDLPGVVTATELWAAQATTGQQRNDAAAYLHQLALERGRPTEASRTAGAMLREWAAEDRAAAAAVRAAWGDDDAEAGAAAAAMLMAASVPLAPDDNTRAAQLHRRCAAEQFRVSTGVYATVGASVELFRRGAPDQPAWLPPLLEGCALYLEGMAAAAAGDPKAAQIAEALDAWQREMLSANWSFPALLATGCLWSAVGNWERASAALERRSPKQVAFLPMTLRLAGAAATQVGDRKAALRAYSHYLALRSDAEPTLQPEVAAVREALAGLLAATPEPGMHAAGVAEGLR